MRSVRCSFLLVGLAAVYGNLVNDTILTGFSTSLAGFPTATASLGLILASEQDATRFGACSIGSMVANSHPALSCQALWILHIWSRLV